MILYEKFRQMQHMNMYQTFHLKKERQYTPLKNQVARNSVKNKPEIIQETQTKKITISDLSGLSWIVIEEYD